VKPIILHRLQPVSNLLASTKLEEKPRGNPQDTIEESPGFYRGVIVDTLTIVSALFTGYIFELFISGEPLIGIGVPPTWTTLLATLSIFLISSLLESVLVKNTVRHLFIIALQVGALSAFLYEESSAWLITFISALVIFSWASWSARNETENSLQIRFFKVAHTFLGKAILAVALMGVVFYFPVWQSQPRLVPDETLNSIIDYATDFTAGLYGNLSFNSESGIEKVIEEISRSQFEGNPLWIQLPLQEREEQLKALQAEMTDRLRGVLGLEEVNPEEKVREVVRRSLENNVRNLEQRFEQWFFWGWMAIMLVVVLGVGRIYGLLLAFVALLIYEVLIVTKFIRVYTEARNKEILDF